MSKVKELIEYYNLLEKYTKLLNKSERLLADRTSYIEHTYQDRCVQQYLSNDSKIKFYTESVERYSDLINILNKDIRRLEDIIIKGGTFNG